MTRTSSNNIKEGFVNLNDLHLNPDNPRLIKDDKFKKLVSSIKDFPKMMELRPIVIDDTMTILGGNMRYNALQSLGFTEIPDNWVKKASNLTTEEKKRFIIEDNLPFGEWDWNKLANQFEVGDLLEWGFDEKDLKIEQGVVEDEVPEVSDEPAVSKLGEVYQLGRHRLMCGDATKIEDVEKLMNGQKADMVFTDPPYNIDFGYKEYNDKKSKVEYEQFCKDWFNLWSLYPLIFTPGPRNTRNYPEPTDIGTWVKKGGKTGATTFYLRFCEPILFYGKFFKKRDTDLFEFNSGDFLSLNSNGLNSGIDIHKDNRQYAPAKPLKLVADIVNSFSDNNTIIADCFGGNGTTLIACEQTNRTCFMCELDPRYVDVIRKRYAKFVGKEDQWQTITSKL